MIAARRIAAPLALLVIGGCTGRSAGPSDLGPLWDAGTPRPYWVRLPGELSAENHTATRLADGTVLLAGGSRIHSWRHDSLYMGVRSAYRFDPRTNKLSSEEPLRYSRTHHRAVRLRDGRVLLVGGVHLMGEPPPPDYMAEVFAPTAPQGSRWRLLPGMTGYLYLGAAVLLPDGKVLRVHGAMPNFAYDPQPPRPHALFDPRTERWRALARPLARIVSPAAFVTPDGSGVYTLANTTFGSASDRIEYIDASTGQSRLLARLLEPRAAASVARLGPRQFLLIGGHGAELDTWDPSAYWALERTAERVDLASGERRRIQLGNRFRFARSITLPSGNVVVFGGRYGDCRVTALIERSGGYRRLPDMPYGRCGGFSATLLEDGSILVAGGQRSDPLAHRATELLRFYPRGL